MRESPLSTVMFALLTTRMIGMTKDQKNEKCSAKYLECENLCGILRFEDNAISAFLQGLSKNKRTI